MRAFFTRLAINLLAAVLMFPIATALALSLVFVGLCILLVAVCQFPVSVAVAVYFVLWAAAVSGVLVADRVFTDEFDDSIFH